MKAWRYRALLAILFAVSLNGCGKTERGVSAGASRAGGAADSSKPDTTEGLSLKPDEIQKLGIVTAIVAPAVFAGESAGYAVVLPHEQIAQALAEIASARAAVAQSRTALARVRRLAGTPGAFPLENQESASRQAATDEAALALAERRLSGTLGQRPPWKQNARGQSLLRDLANGEAKLVKATFPLGVLEGAAPQSLRISRLGTDDVGRSLRITMLWDAPADPTVPGRAFFGVLKGGNLGEGERAQVWTATGTEQSGVVIPTSAVVLSDGKFWCYVERPAGRFVRTPVDTHAAVADGYFIAAGIDRGEKIVSSGAGLLLARETTPAADAE